MEPSFSVRIGLVIRKHRTKLHYSQEAFADAAEINRAHMGRIERGEVDITMGTGNKIAAKLGVKLSQLVREAENLKPK